MSEIVMAVGDDPQVLELVKGMADPSLTKEEVIGKAGERGDWMEVAPGVFLCTRGQGMSSKWLYYRNKRK